MIGLLLSVLWLIYFLTYSSTKRTFDSFVVRCATDVTVTAAFNAGTLNALTAECTHRICQQVLRPQVQVQVL